jgi:hypothetical protein
MSESPDEAREQDEQTPATEELQEPSTEKPAGGEPKAAESDEPEPSHQSASSAVLSSPRRNLTKTPCDT